MNRITLCGVVACLAIVFSTASAQDNDRSRATQTVKFGVTRSLPASDVLVSGATRIFTIAPRVTMNSAPGPFRPISFRSPVLSQHLISKALAQAARSPQAVFVTITD